MRNRSSRTGTPNRGKATAGSSIVRVDPRSRPPSTGNGVYHVAHVAEEEEEPERFHAPLSPCDLRRARARPGGATSAGSACSQKFLYRPYQVWYNNSRSCLYAAYQVVGAAIPDLVGAALRCYFWP